MHVFLINLFGPPIILRSLLECPGSASYDMIAANHHIRQCFQRQVSTERTESLKSTPFRAAGTPTRDGIVGGATLHNLRVSIIFLKDF